MEYRDASGGAILASRRPARECLRDHIVNEIAPRVPATSWREADEVPLRYTTDIQTLVLCCLPHCTGDTTARDAVYVLECLHNSGHATTALQELGKHNPRWAKAQSADRLLYVGVAKNLLRRLNQHLNDPGGAGAHFTTVFPPIRILDVSWYRNHLLAGLAERMLARELRKRFEDDYVSQPG
jgi:predicted GIY-YIG superfamily endonuclease